MTTELTDASASYAVEVARLLWPAPWEAPALTRGRQPTAGTHRDAYVFPSESRPRLLVPADVRDSSVMIRRLGGSGSVLARPARRVLERSVRSRAFPLLRWPVLRVQGDDPAADSVERHLGECLGTEVRIGVLLGTRRVNQKPVLQIFDRAGSVLGYAKVGHNVLTAELVRREADALATIGDRAPRSFRVPRVLHHGSWAGLEVLVTSPLTTTAEVVTPATRLGATRELSRTCGTTDAVLGDGCYGSRVQDEVAALEETPDAERLRSAVGTLLERDGGTDVRLGGWHGDWGRWNMGMAEGILHVWDWERYDPEVPLGFDALHFAAQSVRPGDRRAAHQEAAFLRSVPALLAEHGVPASRHSLTLRLYLVEIALRYLDALRHGATPALRRRTAWVLSLLERELGPAHHPPTPQGEGRS